MAGARRAAYITVWLAIAESLRRKFSEAAVRDHRAANVVRQVNRREEQHKAVDHLLLDKAKEYGFITDAEFTQLEHIYENRNVFGHPYEEAPSDLAVEAAAEAAVTIVLGRPVALREGYLSDQVRRLTAEQTFLNDDETRVAEYAAVVHSRSAPDLRLWFIRKLLAALEAVFADPALDVLRRRGEWFLRAFLLTDLTIFMTWDPVDDLPNHLAILKTVLADARLFPSATNHAQDIVVNALVQGATTDPEWLQLLEALSAAQVLRTEHESVLDEALTQWPVRQIVRSRLPLSRFWLRIVEELSVHNYYRQNDAIGAWETAGLDQTESLEPPAQEALGRNLMQAAEGGARKAIYLLAALREGTWPLDSFAVSSLSHS